jgi:hypothetical protein
MVWASVPEAGPKVSPRFVPVSLFSLPFLLPTLYLLQMFSGPSCGPLSRAVRDTFLSDRE